MADRDGRALAVWYQLAPERAAQLALLRFPPVLATRQQLWLRCGDVLLNRMTLPLLQRFARWSRAHSQVLAQACYRKMYQRVRRQAVREELGR